MTKKVTRAEVYAAIDGERDYQDAHCLYEGAHEFTGGEFITMMGKYTNELPALWALNPGDAPDKVLCNMRKIAAIAVQCLEVHGVIPREVEGKGGWGTVSEAEKEKAQWPTDTST